MRKGENIKHSQGGGSWQRITSSSVVVFEGGASPPSTPFLMPTHQGRDGQKKNPPPTSQKVDIFISSWYTVYAEGRQGFSIDLRGLFTTFRSSEVYGSCISRICGFCESSRQCVLLWLFSLVALQHHLSKRQRHRRLTSAAFGDIIKLQNRRGGSLPKGR